MVNENAYMDKRTFLKTSSALVAGSMISPMVSCQQKEIRTNWAGNYAYKATHLHQPNTVEQIQEIIKSNNSLKALGTCHSFNSIADSRSNQVSLQQFDPEISLDEEFQTVTVGGGLRYGQLCIYLHSKGYSLHNLASLPHISIAGACATATHGSGDNNGNLATIVSAMEFVSGDGDVIVLSREKDGEEFNGAVVSLGGIGIVTKLTLDVQTVYNMRQVVYQNLPHNQLENHFDEIFSSGYSVSLFSDWGNPHIDQVWIKRQIDDGEATQPEPEFYNATLAKRHLHPIEALSAENCTEQMGMPGPWYDRLPHFKMDFTPSSGEELQSEYFVPRKHAVDAILAVYKLREYITPQLQISEVRSIAADHLWMSPCYEQDSVSIHFTWKPNWKEVRKLLTMIETELAPYHVRPHWGKLFTIPPARLQSLYQKLPDFQQLLKIYDPMGKFRNAFLRKHIFSN